MASKTDRQSLAETFDRHVEEEGKILAEYRALSEKLGSGAAGFLINLILTEEEMHHLLLRTTAKWLREPPTEEERRMPREVNRDELLRYTVSLQEHEQETIDACRRLDPQLSGEDRDVIQSVLDVMTLDSEKHWKLLAAVQKLIRGR